MFLRGDGGGHAYRYGVGIEIWAVIALITVLSVYLLPYLVGRREMARRSNVQDRYSAELRVLATGAAAVEHGNTCASSGHAELFRRRPEVRVMNRPAVRNVRAVRTERELSHARQVHARGRERRRVAASHRGIVACVLLGVSLGAWVLGFVTALPWWPALLPTALLGVSMVAGRRAALASAAADRRERRRIAEIEHTLVTLTGRRSSASVVAAPRSVVDGARSASSGADSSSAASLTGESRAAQDPFMERLAREGAQRAAARSATSAQETAGPASADTTTETMSPAAPSSASAAETAGARPSYSTDSEADRLGASDADLDTVLDAASRDGDEESSPRAQDVGASSPSTPSRRLVGWGKLFAEASAIARETHEASASAPDAPAHGRQVAPPAASESACPAEGPQAPAAGASAEGEEVTQEEMTTSTPPQGWRPVHVPAPTYTLAARAPRRSYADPVVDPGTSAPVPARPQTARAYVPAPVEDDEEELFHPIDLDAILEGRHAAGE